MGPLVNGTGCRAMNTGLEQSPEGQGATCSHAWWPTYGYFLKALLLGLAHYKGFATPTWIPEHPFRHLVRYTSASSWPFMQAMNFLFQYLITVFQYLITISIVLAK